MKTAEELAAEAWNNCDEAKHAGATCKDCIADAIRAGRAGAFEEAAKVADDFLRSRRDYILPHNPSVANEFRIACEDLQGVFRAGIRALADKERR